MKCLDSTFLIDLLRSDSGAVKKASALREGDAVTTSANVFEVCNGIFRSRHDADSEKEFEMFRKLFGALDIYPVDADGAVLASMISGKLIRAGKRVNGIDCLIAGVMLSKKCTVIITRDKEHFSLMKGIRVETY